MNLSFDCENKEWKVLGTAENRRKVVVQSRQLIASRNCAYGEIRMLFRSFYDALPLYRMS